MLFIFVPVPAEKKQHKSTCQSIEMHITLRFHHEFHSLRSQRDRSQLRTNDPPRGHLGQFFANSTFDSKTLRTTREQVQKWDATPMVKWCCCVCENQKTSADDS